MTRIPLPTASYDLPSRSPGRLLNCWAQTAPQGKSPVELVGLPGIATQATFTGAGRGLHVARNRLLAVAGGTLYDVLRQTPLGSVGGGSDPVTFATLPQQTVLSTGHVLEGDAVTLIDDPERVPWAAIGYCDGFVLGVEAGTGRFVGSALNDGTSYNGLDFATAEGSPDDLVTLVVDHRQAVLAGTESVEVWYNAGGSGFPFERVANGFVELGCLARHGIVKADNSVFWLASDRTVRRLSGSTPVRVSQNGVEAALGRYTVTDCRAFSFTWGGQVHVWFRFPTENASWVLNVSTGEWWESDLPLVAAATFEGQVYVQHEDGRVGRLTISTARHFGATSRVSVTWPSIVTGGRHVLAQADFALRTGEAEPGTIPLATLEVSHDGGNTYHTMPLRELGRAGEYLRVLRWSRLGQGRETVLRLSCAEAVPFHLTDASVVVL